MNYVFTLKYDFLSMILPFDFYDYIVGFDLIICFFLFRGLLLMDSVDVVWLIAWNLSFFNQGIQVQSLRQSQLDVDSNRWLVAVNLALISIQ